jgi:hypothetical protein
VLATTNETEVLNWSWELAWKDEQEILSKQKVTVKIAEI